MHLTPVRNFFARLRDDATFRCEFITKKDRQTRYSFVAEEGYTFTPFDVVDLLCQDDFSLGRLRP